MIQAAGILYVAPQRKALFLKRGPGSDHPGAWCFPGGRMEPGETAAAAAEREAVEELGMLIEGEHELWTRSIAPPFVPPVVQPVAGQEAAALDTVDFTTFLQQVPKEFEPKLNGEHVGWAWAPIDQPPMPLHPGCQVALDRFGMNELDIAQAMREGRLTSPQRYENLYLFDIRISGTGISYRAKHNEYVYRKTENYLTPQFVARCNGLPVIVEHPSTDVLTTREFSQRVVGTVFLPYIKGDEVWAIAKIYDEPTARLMAKRQLSTSPAVVFRDPSVNLHLEMEDGSSLLVEGDPSLLDHVALCEVGVWDKGGDPAGVISADITGEPIMAEKTEVEETKDDSARNDAAENGQKLDKLLSHMDSLHDGMSKLQAAHDSLRSRVDSMSTEHKADSEEHEEHKADSEEEEHEERHDAEACKDCGEVHEGDCADERADAEQGEEFGEPMRVAADRHRKDSAHADSALLRAEIKRLESMIVRPATDADIKAMSAAQAKADRVFEAFGDAAPRPLQGETLLNYRIRLADALKAHSPTLKSAVLDRIAVADSATFDVLEEQIYRDASAVARSPSTVRPGELRMVTRRLDSGHTVNEFIGEPGAWMSQFAPERQYVTNFNQRLGGN